MRTPALLATVLLLCSCSLPVFFRVPVVQGNVVTAKQVGKLERGMTKRQVKYVMGTPLIDSGFDNDRWDFVFYYRDPRAHVRKSDLRLFFVNGQLSDIEGNEEYTAQVLDRNDGSDFQPAGNNPMPGEVSPGPNNRAIEHDIRPGPVERTPTNVPPGPGERNPATGDTTPGRPDRPLSAPLPGT